MPAFAGMTSFVVRGDGKRYGVVTLHRPSNVDSIEMMARIGGALKEIAAELPLIFPLHPHTRGNLVHSRQRTSFNSSSLLRLSCGA